MAHEWTVNDVRLIDADALPVVAECCMDEAGYLAKFKVVHEEDIKKATTIEAETVKHGRWIKAAAYNDGVINTAYCSVCRTFLPISNWDYHNYCPTCGAKMDGGDAG